MDIVDPDQCLTNNGGCAHNCTNTATGFNCSCYEGYYIDDNGFSCHGKLSIIPSVCN